MLLLGEACWHAPSCISSCSMQQAPHTQDCMLQQQQLSPGMGGSAMSMPPAGAERLSGRRLVEGWLSMVPTVGRGGTRSGCRWPANPKLWDP